MNKKVNIGKMLKRHYFSSKNYTYNWKKRSKQLQFIASNILKHCQKSYKRRRETFRQCHVFVFFRIFVNCSVFYTSSTGIRMTFPWLNLLGVWFGWCGAWNNAHLANLSRSLQVSIFYSLSMICLKVEGTKTWKKLFPLFHCCNHFYFCSPSPYVFYFRQPFSSLLAVGACWLFTLVRLLVKSLATSLLSTGIRMTFPRLNKLSV